MPDAILGKPCSKCKVWKPREQFGTEARRPDGLRCYCKTCGAVQRRESEKNGSVAKYRRSERYKINLRKQKLRQRFGLTPDSYDTLLASQDGRCAICRSDKPGGRWNRFHVDHDHETKAVRGLLCHGCNTALGVFGDNAEGLRRALDYLTQSSIGSRSQMPVRV